MRWYRKKVIFGVSMFVVLFFIFRNKNNDVKYTILIPNAQPIQIWEFLADFNNMKILNPTITQFTIESDSGNYRHWKYRVFYEEHLSQLPLIKNFAWADYEIKILPMDKYAIYSTHKTCFLTSLTCVRSKSAVVLESTNKTSGTLYTEFITYECPMILSSFCRKEVMFQREAIKTNLLQKIF